MVFPIHALGQAPCRLVDEPGGQSPLATPQPAKRGVVVRPGQEVLRCSATQDVSHRPSLPPVPLHGAFRPPRRFTDPRSSLHLTVARGPSVPGSLAPSFRVTPRMQRALAEVDQFRGFLMGAMLAPQWVARMQDRALVLEAHHTTRIEGTRLTLAQSEAAFAGALDLPARPDDIRELLNYRSALDMVSNYLASGAPITEVLIREIHARLVTGVRGDAARPGQYRKIQNFVVDSSTKEVIYEPPSAAEVGLLMGELVAWLREDTEAHPVLAAGIAQFQLVHIHPFLDGNGRTARLLSTLALYRSGYDVKRLFSISQFYDRDRAAYYAAIQSVRDDDMDLTRWLEYFTEGLATQMREVRVLGEQAMRADGLAQRHGLNTRQHAAVLTLLERGALSVDDYADMWPEVTRATLNRDLRFLRAQGIAFPLGVSGRKVYRLVD